MKNVKNLFGMAVMATALVGCSSNDNLNPNANDGAGKTGEAYASFKINLPTTSGTRATEGEPSFDGGTAKEYEVKNGTILIFDANNSDKFVTRVELGTMNPWKEDTDNNGVTTAASVTVQLSGVELNGNYKALVLLNNNSETTPKVTLPTTTDTYDDWSAKASNANATEYVKTDGIFMANAPMYISTTTEPTTLVKINKVYASREQAQANSATVVYVERGLAKVTMKDFKSSGYTIAGNTYAGDKVEIKKWKLDVTNKSTFPVHQLGSLSTDYTGIWSDTHFFDGTNATFKRVYWGIDPNYSNNKLFDGTTTPAPAKTALEYCQDNFNMITNAQVDGEAGDANPQYCLENTFNLDNMKQGQTTRVVFKAVYTPKTFTSGETFYKVANNTAVWHEADLKQQILTLALKAMNITDATEQGKYDVDLSKGSNISGAADQHLIQEANITYSGEAASSKVTADVVNKINDKLGLSEDPTTHKVKVGISTYFNGEAYYIARIKHFNELTPWTAGDAYGSKNDKYLGRYGVLRNNWYELSVKSISNLGYPEVPEVKPETPDDENDKYINVEVKILDWAKRTQQIEL